MKLTVSKISWVIACVFLLYFPNVHAGKSGEDLYFNNCMACHSYDGSGSMPGVLDFNEITIWSTMDETSLFSLLKEGIQKDGSSVSMPPKGGNPDLTDKELKKIIRYLLKTFKK